MSQQEIFEAVTKAIALFANLDYQEIKKEDNLEDDLFLNLETDIPQIISNLAQEFDVEAERDLIADFVEQALEDSQKATVLELSSLVEEIVQF